ncbi:carbohydrate binding family 9 domain-containing protein [Pseudomaricurvus sp.]|uniref:carbohydrate binding family 9 domain-containing protein n=1 Tax=Pseudomaricurvus sp. TaxID=2004510 RepID=UPI003F6D7BA0
MKGLKMTKVPRQRFFQQLTLVLLALSQGAWSQSQNNNDDETKYFSAIKLDVAPVIDGYLDDPVWQKVTAIDDFHQINPGDGVPPTEKTEVYLTYDKDYLYFAGTLYEKDPSQISANVMQNGQGFPNDDRITIVIDPFNTGKSGYRFETNPLGGRNDGLYVGDRFSYDWQVIWQSASQITDYGWTFEMAIPFKSIPFDQNIDTWGVNFSRGIRRSDEEAVWVSRNRTFNPNIQGMVTGLEGMDQGIGLDIVPSVSISQQREYDPNSSHVNFEPSLDAYYRITPSLNWSLTFNTDFSATEVDDRQVDLTRFGLFFPEKRDFFLNDSDLFSFGNIQSSDNQVHRGSTQQNGRPFFSRRIGLGADGSPVDIEVGTKLSGRAGPWSIGTLAVRQAENGDIDASDLLVTRIQHDVLSESKVGFIFTSGDPRSNLDNTLYGMDFLYTNTRLAGDNTLDINTWVQKTETEGLSGDDMAYGVGFNVPNNEGLKGGIQFREIQQNFRPALGFVNRVNVRDYDANIGYKHFFNSQGLGKWFQSLDARIDAESIHVIDGGLQSATYRVQPISLVTHSNDKLQFSVKQNREVVDKPFRLFRDDDSGLLIKPGDYTFDEYTISLDTGGYRSVYGSLSYTGGEFYDGDRVNISSSMTWQPSPKFNMSLRYDWNDITMPDGDFITRLVVADVTYNFALGLSWKTLIQYDNVSEVTGLNSRLSWNEIAGREAFLVLNHNWQDFDQDNHFENASSELVLKLGYTFRF